MTTSYPSFSILLCPPWQCLFDTEQILFLLHSTMKYFRKEVVGHVVLLSKIKCLFFLEVFNSPFYTPRTETYLRRSWDILKTFPSFASFKQLSFDIYRVE